MAVVFPGYSDKLHGCCSDSSSADIQIKLSTKVTTSREAFLVNPNKNVQLIKMLFARLQATGFMTEQSKGDTNTLSLKSAITYEQDGRSVITMTHLV